jgi:hypothetical protein
MRDRTAGGHGIGALLLVMLLAFLAAPHASALRGHLPPLTLGSGLPGGTVHGPPSAIPTAPGAGRAVAFALAQRGKPYRWGAEGPSGFDCSGLTWAAWHAAGVELPRTAAAQYARGGPRIARDQLRPGDLVFFHSSGPSGWHVGLAVDRGRMVEAPGRHAPVRVAGIRRAGYRGAVRPTAPGGAAR